MVSPLYYYLYLMQDIHHVLTSTAKILWRSRHGQEWPDTSEEFINDQSSKFLCQELQQVAFMDSSCVVEIVIALTPNPLG